MKLDKNGRLQTQQRSKKKITWDFSGFQKVFQKLKVLLKMEFLKLRIYKNKKNTFEGVVEII